MSYKAIFFDLDGTLLPIDAGGMVKAFFEFLTPFLARKGYEDAEQVSTCLNRATRAMALSSHDRLNGDVFWEVFTRLSGIPQECFEPHMVEFYRTDFNHIGERITPNPTAAAVVETLHEKGYPLYLTTMPLFPRVGIEQRLSWAGVDPSLFECLTTFENSHAAKPHSDYYRENIVRAGVDPHDVLVVGNHTIEDLAPTTLGCDAYLVTDMLLEGIGVVDWRRVRKGSLEDFRAFVEALPPCAG